MKIFKITFNAFIILLLSSHLFGKKPLNETELLNKINLFPDYRAVVTHFFKFYESPGHILNFAKKNDGWYVYTVRYEVFDTINTEKIWDFNKNKYLKLKFYSKFKPSDNNNLIGIDEEKYDPVKYKVSQFISYYDEQEYNLHPYYGYPGWNKDVIDLLSALILTNENLIYSLARAYSNLASNILRPQFGFQKQIYPSAEYEKIEKKRLDEYLFNANKAIEHFLKLYRQNPDFQTIVGNIYTKYSNECLTVYFHLLSIKEENLALHYLKDSLYQPELLVLTKNYLIACPENAILITNGDNDTYPLWYLQAKFGIRKDVRVVNFQLMQTSWYIDMLRYQYLDSEPIRMSFEQDKIKNSKREFALIYNNSEINTDDESVYYNLKDALSVAFSDDDNNILKTSGLTYNVFPYRKLYIPVSKNPFKYGEITKKYTERISDTVFFEIGFSQYLLRNTLILLDIIQEATWQRPVCFANTVASNNFHGLDKYLMSRACIYQLIPIEADSLEKLNSLIWINTDICYSNLMKNFSFSTFKEQTNKTDNAVIQYVQIFRSDFISLSNVLLNQKDTFNAYEVLKYGLNIFPEKFIPYDLSILNGIIILYKAGKLKEGDKLAGSMINQIEKDFIIFQTADRFYTTEDAIRVLEILKESAENYFRNEISGKSEIMLRRLKKDN